MATAPRALLHVVVGDETGLVKRLEFVDREAATEFEQKRERERERRRERGEEDDEEQEVVADAGGKTPWAWRLGTRVGKQAGRATEGVTRVAWSAEASGTVTLSSIFGSSVELSAAKSALSANVPACMPR